MGEIRIVGPGKTRGYPYPVCKKTLFGQNFDTKWEADTYRDTVTNDGLNEVTLPILMNAHQITNSGCRNGKFLQ